MESAHKVPVCEILRNNTEDLKTDVKDYFNDFQLPGLFQLSGLLRPEEHEEN